ncbi:MAG: DUF3592 domain-containing protein [Verrucomicrobiota bacterium]
MIGQFLIRAIISGHLWPPIGLLSFGIFAMVWQVAIRVPEEAAFKEQGVETLGEIIELRKEKVGWLVSSSRGARIHIVKTEFTDPTGTRQRFEDEVSRRSYADLSVGDSLRVIYVSDRPSMARLLIREHRISPDQNFNLWLWISGIAALWLAITLMFRFRSKIAKVHSL